MFMKHYAPNRCLYIKVAKLRTGVGSAEMSHLQNYSLKIYLKRARGEGGQDGFERRIKVFMKIQKVYIYLFFFFYFFFFFFWGGRGRVGGGGGSGWGGGVRVDVYREVKFL